MKRKFVKNFIDYVNENINNKINEGKEYKEKLILTYNGEEINVFVNISDSGAVATLNTFDVIGSNVKQKYAHWEDLEELLDMYDANLTEKLANGELHMEDYGDDEVNESKSNREIIIDDAKKIQDWLKEWVKNNEYTSSEIEEEKAKMLKKHNVKFSKDFAKFLDTLENVSIETKKFLLEEKITYDNTSELINEESTSFWSEMKDKYGYDINDKTKSYKVKTLSKQDGEDVEIGEFANFDASGSITGMKKLYYGKNALLVKCGGYIYNVTSVPSIYFDKAN